MYALYRFYVFELRLYSNGISLVAVIVVRANFSITLSLAIE